MKWIQIVIIALSLASTGGCMETPQWTIYWWLGDDQDEDTTEDTEGLTMPVTVEWIQETPYIDDIVVQLPYNGSYGEMTGPYNRGYAVFAALVSSTTATGEVIETKWNCWPEYTAKDDAPDYRECYISQVELDEQGGMGLGIIETDNCVCYTGWEIYWPCGWMDELQGDTSC